MPFAITESLDDRIRRQLRRVANGCLEWQGACDKDGYGQVRIGSHSTNDRRVVRVHRVVWEQANGPIPEGLFVLHSCDNPPCADLEHLFLGTALINMRDKIAKGRARYAAPPIKHIEDIPMIKDLISMGFTQNEIAARLGCSQATISRRGGM